MAFTNPRLITPPREEEERYPYRRVWRSITIEMVLLILLTVGLFVAVTFIGIDIPEAIRGYVNIAIALIPLFLWVLFSWFQERGVPEPRERLLLVVGLSALVANGIGIPLIDNILRPDEWLPLQEAIQRFVGYAITLGITQELLKFLVIRFGVWPDQFRIHLDGVAYGAAAAVGYVTVVNMHYIGDIDPLAHVAAMRVLGNVVVHLVGSCIVGYGLAQLTFNRFFAALTPLTLVLAALFHGIFIPLRAGLVNAPLAIGVSATRPLFGILFSIAMLVVPLVVISFLFITAARHNYGATPG